MNSMRSPACVAGFHRSILAALAALALCAALSPAQLASAQPGPGDDDRPREGRRDGERGDFRGGRGDRGDFRGGRGEGGFGGPGWMRGGVGEVMQPEFMRRDLVLITDELELDADQQAIAEMLVLDYETAFDEALDASRARMEELQPDDPEREARRERWRGMRDRLEEMREQVRAARDDAARVNLETAPFDADGNPKIDEAAAARAETIERLRDEMFLLREESREMRPRFDPAQREQFGETLATLGRELEMERDRLRATFLSNLKTILVEQQLARWETFERALRRSKAMQRGRLSGESTDLFLVLRELALAESVVESIRGPLDAYAISLDGALRARDDYVREHRIDSMQAMFAGETEKVLATAQREQELRVAVRDVNERNAAIISDALAEATDAATGAAFRDGFKERAYERVYRTTRVQRAFDDALEIEGIDETVLASLITLQESYLGELGAFNERLVATIRTEEPGQATRWIERMASWMQRGSGGPGGPERDADGRPDGDRPDDKVREAFDERRELNERYRTQLESLLTPEQRAQLPADELGRFFVNEIAEGDGRGGRGGWRGDRDGEEREEREARRERMMGRYDSNGDGQLDAAERDAARKAMSEGGTTNDETKE